MPASANDGGQGIAETGRLADAEMAARKMHTSRRRSIGIYLTLFALTLLATLPWAWSTASHAVAASGRATIRASFLGFKFNASPEFSLILIVILSASLGSVAVLGMTFSARAGYETLERGYLWWYLTRPFSAAALGVLFYMAVVAGFFSSATQADRPALVVAAAIGGLAGLFTDQVLKKMRSVLGLLPLNKAASDKPLDETDQKPAT